jgi:subfamily B ATP-binding cassette protein MsbA
MKNVTYRLTLKKLWKFIRNLRWALLLACVLAIIKGLSGLGLVAVSRWLLNNYQVLTSQILFTLYGIIIAFLILYIAIIYYRSYLPVYISSNAVKEMRRDLYYHLQRLSADFYAQHKTGEIVSRITNDISITQFLFSAVLINVCFDFFTIAAGVIYLLLSYPIEISLPVLGVCVIYMITIRIFLPKVKDISVAVQEELGKIAGDVSEKVMGMKVLQSFTHEEIASHGLGDKLEAHYFVTMKMGKLQSWFSTINQMLPEAARLLIVVIGIYLMLAARLTMGDITGLMLILGHLLFSFQRSAETSLNIGTGIGALDRVFDFFDAQPIVREIKNPVKLEELAGEIRYDNVSFSYPFNEGSMVLHNISLIIPAGSRVAFAGPSGAGKSTMMDLLSRFYDPAAGTIYIDDIDIKKLKLNTLRKNIGIVMQDTVLFSGTVADNIRIGNPKASDEEVQEALKNASAWDFVAEMKDQMYSYIGERGVTLSGGQRQRLAIARIFLKNPRILVLDEATSALDSESEYFVQQAILNLMKGRTTLMIAHRLSSVKDVDRVYVIEAGKIVEQGSMDELLESDGTFKKLYERQSLSLTDS